MEILAQLNTQFDKVSSIEKKLFSVYDMPIEAPTHIELGIPTSVEIQEPTGKKIYTSDGRYLGQTGNQYSSLQPKDFFQTIIESVADFNMDVDFDKIRYGEYKGGQVIDFRIPLETLSWKNVKGFQEEVTPFLEFKTAFAGVGATRIGLFTERLVCTNGMKVKDSHGALKIRNTANGNAKALLYTKDIAKTVNKVDQFKDLWEKMSQVKVSNKEVVALARQMAAIKEDEKLEDLKRQKRETYEQILGAFDHEFKLTDRTVWGLLQGTTYYTNHIADNRGADYLNINTGKKLNDMAQQYCEALVS